MMPTALYAIQVLYGIFWLYTGLNGFFHWQKIPHISKEIDTINEVFISSGFLMTTVKIVEIIGALTLITGFGSFIGLLLMTPLLWGICGLHLRYNPKPWGLLAVLLVPYLILVWKHHDYWPRLL